MSDELAQQMLLLARAWAKNNVGIDPEPQECYYDSKQGTVAFAGRLSDVARPDFLRMRTTDEPTDEGHEGDMDNGIRLRQVAANVDERLRAVEVDLAASKAGQQEWRSHVVESLARVEKALTDGLGNLNNTMARQFDGLKREFCAKSHERIAALETVVAALPEGNSNVRKYAVPAGVGSGSAGIAAFIIYVLQWLFSQQPSKPLDYTDGPSAKTRTAHTQPVRPGG